MCGIAGYFGTREIESKRVQACLRLMHHRGPDHTAFRCWNNPAGLNAYLLFTRLSIIDLDPRANQPFAVGSKHMVFNGELYNYIELREQLAVYGRRFTTSSDVEVLLGAIDHSGFPMLDSCEGMWAFALYDEAQGSLSLVRDRFGEKPLYLFRDPSGLYFGSEVKFIFALLGRRLDVNHDHLYRYLVNGYKALYKDRNSFFKGLCELPPASVLHIDAAGKEILWRYWEPRLVQDEAMPYADAVKGAREHLIHSMQLRLRADVPLAFCMSGGVDSNVLISIAKRIFDYDVHGFTIVNEDSRYEEQEMMNHAVKSLGIRHTAIPVSTRNFLPRLCDLVRDHDAPVYTISYYAHRLLMESIAEHGYRVSVSGTAADELFSGYYDHHLAYLYEIHGDSGSHANALQSWEKYIRPFVRNRYLTDPDLFIKNPNFRDHIFLDADKFSRYLKTPWREPFAERNYTDSLLRNRMLNEIFHETVPPILHEDDLNAMRFSIENRSPYLDRGLFEFCCSIPSRHLVQEGFAKAVLRDAARGIAPDGVLDNHRKVGFNAPILSFLDLQDPEVRGSVLSNSEIFEHVQRERIMELMDKPYLPNSESKFLFYFLSAKIFLDEFGAAAVR